MNTLIRLVIVSMIYGLMSLNAQDFQGIATYKTKRKVDLKIDSTNTSMTPDLQKQMSEILKKQFEKTYILSFNKEESIYKEDVELETPGSGGVSFNGISINAIGGGENDILYKNTKSGTFINQSDLFGKIFLIKDNLEPIEWILEKDTKNIGEYICYKATYTEEIEVFEESFDKKTTKTRNITAWYTPQIPVSNGPAKYHGLPGLILEFNDGDQQIVCNKIVLNPESKLAIKKPKQGKEVNQKEYDAIRDKKVKEFEERYRPTGRESGDQIQISIGG